MSRITTSYLGRYARNNNKEMLAQAIAYEMHSENTNPYSAEIKRLFDLEYKNWVAGGKK